LNLEYTNLSLRLTSNAPDLGGAEFPFILAWGAIVFMNFDTRAKSG